MIHKLSFKIIKDKYLLSILFVLAVIVYWKTSAGETPYDYFTRLSEAFLQGRYWLEENPSWLNELIPYGGRYYVPYPPMPAVLAIPFVAVFKGAFQQQYLAHLLGAGSLVISYYLAFELSEDRFLSYTTAILTGFGSIIWFLSAAGAVWYLGQVSAFFFFLLALLSILKNKHLLAGVFLGATYASRVHVILAGIFFAYMILKEKNRLTNLIKFSAGVAPFVLLNTLYNYIRYGAFWDVGYRLIPGVLEEPWYSKGLVHPSYIPDHLKIIFTKMPIFLDQAPYIQPSWGGLAIWITTPAFILALLAPIRDRLVQVAWLTLILVSLPVLMHGGTGFTQFGYRYAVDLYPLLIILTVLGANRINKKWFYLYLVLVGVLVNLWGVVWINHFGWVSF